MVHPPGARGSRDSGLRRRLADPRLRLRGRRRRTRFCAPGPATRATARRSTSAATSTSRIAIWCSSWSSSPGAAAIDSSNGRRRRRRLTSAASTPTRPASAQTTGWTPPVPLREGLARTLAFYRRAHAALPRSATADERMTVRFNALAPGDDAPAVRAAIDRVVASGWFILGPEVDGVRVGVRRAHAARRSASASAPAPTRSRWRSARSASGRATK